MPASQNGYSYVHGNPVNYTDFSGLCAENGDDACWAVYEQIARRYPGILNNSLVPASHGYPGKELYELPQFALNGVLGNLNSNPNFYHTSASPAPQNPNTKILCSVPNNVCKLYQENAAKMTINNSDRMEILREPLGNSPQIGWIYHMPIQSVKTVSRPESLQRLGVGLSWAGLIADFVELGMIVCTPLVPDEHGASIFDLSVTTIAGFASGENHFFERPDPNLPRMLSVNDDFLVTAGDYTIALGADALLSSSGAIASVVTANPAPATVGYGVSKVIDVGTTGYSIYHDINKVWFLEPNSVSVGVSTEGVTIINWPDGK